MTNVRDLLKTLDTSYLSEEEKLAALSQIENTIKEIREKKEYQVKFNVQIILDEINKLKSEVKAQLDYARSIVPERGPKGDPGARGQDGVIGKDGRDGRDGKDGKDGVDGQDGISVSDAKVDFDGSLVITLSDGREIDAGEVVSPELAEQIKVTMSTNSTVAIEDEGVLITSGVRNINFIGAGVTVTGSDDSVTVDIPGGGGGGGSGTVTSVAVSGGTTGLTTSGGPITTSGTITIAGTLSVANGGTGQTTQQAAINALAGATTSGQFLRGNGTNVSMSAIQAGDVPTLNQNTTGTAANVTGTVAVANGGTGATTADTARTNLSAQKTITSGTAAPSGGVDGDIYLQYV